MIQVRKWEESGADAPRQLVLLNPFYVAPEPVSRRFAEAQQVFAWAFTEVVTFVNTQEHGQMHEIETITRNLWVTRCLGSRLIQWDTGRK